MLIIFDLDGTLLPQRPSSVAPFKRELLPGVREKCAELVSEGHTLAIATNQGGLRKGLGITSVAGILFWVSHEIGIASTRFASGYTQHRKKPQPGMLLELMSEFNSSPNDTIFVGDAQADRQAADAVGIEFAWAKIYFGA